MLEQQQSTLALQRQASQQMLSGKQPHLHKAGLPTGSTSMVHPLSSMSSQQLVGGKKVPAQLNTKLPPSGAGLSRDEAVAAGALKSMPKGGVRASTTAATASAAPTGGMSWNPLRLMSPFESSGTQTTGQSLLARVSVLSN